MESLVIPARSPDIPDTRPPRTRNLSPCKPQNKPPRSDNFLPCKESQLLPSFLLFVYFVVPKSSSLFPPLRGPIVPIPSWFPASVLVVSLRRHRDQRIDVEDQRDAAVAQDARPGEAGDRPEVLFQ